jgi:hypothetical protein
MNLSDKYIQYRNKYYKYKTKYNNLQQFGGNKVTTKSNSGRLEGMSNQCFWISILDYLHDNGYPELTLRELRKFMIDANLKINKENEIFDSDLYREASEYIANIFDLKIQAYLIDSNGYILYSGEIINTIGDGRNVVNIAQFGQYHFELIINRENNSNNNFRPLVLINNDLTDVNKIPENIRKQYIKLSENQGEIIIIEKLLKESQSELDKQKKRKNEIKQSPYYTQSEKNQKILKINLFLQNELIPDIKAKTKRIDELKDEMLSLETIIKLYKKGEISSNSLF